MTAPYLIFAIIVFAVCEVLSSIGLSEHAIFGALALGMAALQWKQDQKGTK